MIQSNGKEVLNVPCKESVIDVKQIPECVGESLARSAYPGIRAFYEDPKNQAAFEAWLPTYRARQKERKRLAKLEQEGG